MKTYKFFLVPILSLSLSLSVSGSQDSLDPKKEGDSEEATELEKKPDMRDSRENAKQAADEKAEKELDQFGFGPALYIIKYDDEVLADSKDVTVRGDGTISAKGTEYSTSLGMELHYDFSFGRTISCFGSEEYCRDVTNYELTTAHRLSPFLGLYDVDNGINGIAVGVVYGYIKQHKDKAALTLNTGLGWTVHKDRLVLGSGLSEGDAPPSGLKVEDYTERKDVTGAVLMISVNMGF